jgi:branched-chain amino acid transport system ATP-binding protein
MVDEVCLGLAPRIVDGLIDALVALASELSLGILLVDQNVTMLSKTCHRMYILQNGRTTEVDTAKEDFRSVYFD